MTVERRTSFTLADLICIEIPGDRCGTTLSIPLVVDVDLDQIRKCMCGGSIWKDHEDCRLAFVAERGCVSSAGQSVRFLPASLKRASILTREKA